MSNTVIVLGNLSRDPEIKDVGGDAVLKLAMADNVGFGNRQSTNWFNVDYWGKARSESLIGMLQKGQMIQVTGELVIRPWTNSDGVEKFANDIRADKITLLPRGQSAGATSAPAAQPVANNVGSVSDDIPF